MLVGSDNLFHCVNKNGFWNGRHSVGQPHAAFFVRFLRGGKTRYGR